MPAQFYILHLGSGNLYVGATTDLERRWQEHVSGDATGILLSMVQTCRAMDIDPRRYIEDVLRRINGHPANRLQELLPGNWDPAAAN